MRIPALIFFILVTCYLLLVTSITPVLAQTNEPVPPNTHNYVQTVMIDTMAAMTCQLTGLDPTGPDPQTGEPKKCLGYDPITGALSFVGQIPASGSGGAIGAMGGLIAVLYNPPISSGDYFRYLARNFGIAKPVYAQGTGFEGLKPLLPVWTVFRNLVYVLFAIAFVLVGLAIMLRIRIDPRTVMTIQNQIPKLIIALLLVTFSYAIAGLLVDVMYVFIFLLFGIVSSIQGLPIEVKTQVNSAQQNFQGANPIGFVNELFKVPVIGGIIGLALNAGAGIQQMISDLFAPKSFGELLLFPSKTAADCKGFVIGCWFGDVFGGTVGTVMSQLVGWLISWVLGILAVLVIAIAILWSLFRLWFQLIFAYVELLLVVVFAPFWILLGVLPGAPIGFGAWLRTVLSDLSPFPVTIAMFLLAKVFMESFKSKDAFVPPLIGNPGGDYSVLASFIGLGFILLTPQVVAMVKDFLKTPIFKYYSAIGQAVGVGTGVPGAIVRPVAAGLSFVGGQAAAKGILGKIGIRIS